MADSALLLDSNILIRWVQGTDADFALVASALDSLSKQGATLCLHPDLSVIRQVINCKNAMLESIAANAAVSTTDVPEVLSFGHKSSHSDIGANSGTLSK